MRKFFNILSLVLTLSLLIALSVYCAYERFHDSLKDVDLEISRKTEKGFVDYDKTYKMILDICDKEPINLTLFFSRIGNHYSIPEFNWFFELSITVLLSFHF